jgi:hypothetical protein
LGNRVNLSDLFREESASSRSCKTLAEPKLVAQALFDEC